MTMLMQGNDKKVHRMIVIVVISELGDIMSIYSLKLNNISIMNFNDIS